MIIEYFIIFVCLSILLIMKNCRRKCDCQFFLQINRKAWYFFSKKPIQFANPILNMGTSLKFEIIARGRCLMRKASVRVLCRGTTIPGSWRIGKTKKRRGWSLVKCPASVRLQPLPVLYSNENGMRLSPCCDAIARVAALLKTGCSPLDEHFFGKIIFWLTCNTYWKILFWEWQSGFFSYCHECFDERTIWTWL